MQTRFSDAGKMAATRDLLEHCLAVDPNSRISH